MTTQAFLGNAMVIPIWRPPHNWSEKILDKCPPANQNAPPEAIACELVALAQSELLPRVALMRSYFFKVDPAVPAVELCALEVNRLPDGRGFLMVRLAWRGSGIGKTKLAS